MCNCNQAKLGALGAKIEVEKIYEQKLNQPIRETIQSEMRSQAQNFRERANKLEEQALKLDRFGPEIEEFIYSIRNNLY